VVIRHASVCEVVGSNTAISKLGRLLVATQILTPNKIPAPRGSSSSFRRRRYPAGCKAAQVSGDFASEASRTLRALRAEEERERRVIELLPLVRRVALQMRKRLPVHVETDDLVGAGMMGLLDAVGKFDARKNVKIESYARYRICGAILDELRALDTASRDWRRKSKKMEKTLHDLQAKLGRPAEDEEVAEAAGISLKEWYRTLQDLRAPGMYWPRPMHAINPKPFSEESLVDENQESQWRLCYRQEQRDILNRALTCLSERERQIVLLYHAREMTMKQIGKRLKIDESRVSQIHSAAVVRLRSSVRAFLEKPTANPPSTRELTAGLPN
jgi:RNA polymerase sigma factor FliA